MKINRGVCSLYLIYIFSASRRYIFHADFAVGKKKRKKNCQREIERATTAAPRPRLYFVATRVSNPRRFPPARERKEITLPYTLILGTIREAPSDEYKKEEHRRLEPKG